MPSKDVVFRSFPHNNLWTFYRFNRTNFINLISKNNLPYLISLGNFLENVWSQKGFVPHYLFNKDKSIRVTSFSEKKKDVFDEEMLSQSIVNVSRFKSFTDEGMRLYESGKEHGKRLSRHNCSLVPILETDKNSLSIETPLWLYKYLVGKDWVPVTGHIDLVQFIDGKIWIFDYKPDDSPLVWEQISNYRKILMSMLPNIKLSDIRVGWFDNFNEYVVKV